MNYIEYDPTNRIVVQIYNNNPTSIGSGNAVAQSDTFRPGDEFTNTIYINEVVDGVVNSYSSIRTNPQSARLLEENEHLKQENKLLKAQTQANADRADFQEELIVELAMMVYP